MTELPLLLTALAAGFGAGFAIGWLAARLSAATRVARLDATLRATWDGEARLEQALRSLSYEATAQSHETLARAVAPLHESLRRYEHHLSEMERDRVGAYAELRAQMTHVHSTSTELRGETARLVSALRSPHVRGRWGEHQLRRIVEAAGLLEHCDFAEQVSVVSDNGGQRPDLVVHLHGGRQMVVDAKAPFDAYLSATQAHDERAHEGYLDAHARQLRAHVDLLAGKRYWAAFDQSPEFVVLFVPADPFLDAALQHDPGLLEHAFARNVVLATPATLVALLRTIAFAWRQDAMTRNAIQLHRMARELYARLATMGEHLDRVGASLGAAVTAYNKAVGSLEARVLVTARRFAEMGVAAEPIEAPAQVEVAPRQLQSPEFTTARGESPTDVVASGVGARPSSIADPGDLDPADQPPSSRPMVEKISP